MSHRNTMSRRKKNKTHTFRIDKAIIFVISVLLLMSVFSVYAFAVDSGSQIDDSASVAPVIQADNELQGAADVSMTKAGPLESLDCTVTCNDSNLVLDKSATANEDGTVTINLNAYAIGELVTTSMPADIVLVLDQSGSMDYSFGQRYVAAYDVPAASRSGQNGTNYYVNINGNYLRVYTARSGKIWYYYVNNGMSNITVVPMTSSSDTDPTHVQFYTSEDMTNLDALKDAVNIFINAVQTNAQQNDVDHRIAVVGFANGGPGTGDYSTVGGYYYNTEMLTGSGAPIRYNNLTTYNYTNALQDVSTSAGRTNVASAINMLDAEGATYTNLGLNMAENIFENDPLSEGENRNRIVVMFTDGAPGYSGYDTTVANSAIAESKNIKDDGITVYTVGVFSGADPSQTGNNANGFMNYTSSNYPNATSVYSTGSRVSSDYNYYLTATNPTALNEIFESISELIGDKVEDAVIKDSVKPQFYIPDPVDCTVTPSKYQDDVSVVRNTDGTYTLDVSGVTLSPVVLDSNGNVAPGYEDRVVHATFDIVPNEDFIGGNKVLTNKSDSGVYTSDLSQVLGLFEEPDVDLPISYVPVANDKSIYIGDSIDALSLIKTDSNGAPVYSKLGSSTQYTIDGLNNSYVDIVYEIKQGDTVIAKYKVSAGETTLTLLDENGNPVTDGSQVMITPQSNTLYTITATATPIYTGTSTASTSSVNSNVYVFKPTFTCSDTSIYLSNTTDLNDRITNVTWSCGTEGIENPDGAVPSISYDFVLASSGETINNADEYSPLDVDFVNINIASVKRTDINLTLSEGQYSVVSAHENDDHNFTVYVYKPNITLQDLDVFYGDSVDLNTAIVDEITWECTQIAPAAEGTVPDLIIDFTTVRGSNIGDNYSSFRPKNYTDVNIDVSVQRQSGTVSIKDYCNVTKAGSPSDDHDFTVNLKKGTITIDKTGTNIEEDQSFLFAIKYIDFDGNDAVLYEVIQGIGSKTITGLVAADYTITEQTDWSWRYTADSSTKNVTISSSNPNAQVEFKNSYSNDKWLSGNNFAINLFKALGAD
ncbi:MAG: VWA domain-containing protein [Eubacteriales bacterium]